MTGRPDSAVQACSEDGEELVLELVTDDGYPIPETPWRLELQNGQTRSGRLDREGRKTVRGLPPGVVFALYYTDPDDVRAKAHAARLDAALTAGNLDQVVTILTLAPSEIRATEQALKTYYDRDLEADCRATFPDGIPSIAVAHCLHLAGMTNEALADVVQATRARDVDD